MPLQIQKDAVIEGIDENAVFDFLERANSLRNLNENTFLPVESVLEKLELVRKGELTKVLSRLDLRSSAFITRAIYSRLLSPSNV